MKMTIWIIVVVGIFVILSAVALSVVLPRRASWDTPKGKGIALAVFSFAIGILGLTGLDTLGGHAAHYLGYLGHHVFAIFGAVGAVGLLYEIFLRDAQLVEFGTRMRKAFQDDHEFAKMLSVDVRRSIVKSTLIAHLEKPGEAIYDGVVARYLEEKPFLRNRFEYEAALEDLGSDVVLTMNGQDLTLEREMYFQLLVTCRFNRMFSPTYNTIGCILDEHDKELLNGSDDRIASFVKCSI